jgi:hypothetical protein
MPARRDNPAETEQQWRARIERAIAQLAAAMGQTVGWRPRQHGQDELAAILAEQQQAVELERRPHFAPEQRREGVGA